MAGTNGKSTITTEWSADRPPEGATVQGHVLLQFRIHPRDEDGYFVGECVELGTSSFGESVDDALKATIEATTAYLEALDDCGERDKVFAERGVVFFLAAPADDVDVELRLHPGEIGSTQRLSALVDA